MVSELLVKIMNTGLLIILAGFVISIASLDPDSSSVRYRFTNTGYLGTITMMAGMLMTWLSWLLMVWL